MSAPEPIRGDWKWVNPKPGQGSGFFREPIGPEKRLGRAMLTPFFILIIIALGLSLASLIWPKPFLGPIALLLICIALLIGSRGG